VNDVPSSQVLIHFGVFELDTESGELRKQGVKVHLQDQPFQVLRVLLEHPDRVVTREELQQRIWPSDTFVDFDRGLYNAVKKLREALGDSAESPRFIETLSRRGYRFIAAVSGNGNAAGAQVPLIPVVRPEPNRNLRIGIALGVGAVILLAAASVVRRFWPQSSGQSAPQIRSIAVLPLQNLSPDPAQEYFSDGMTDALITELAQIGGVKVISRTSSMQYKQTKKSLPEIARELNVDGIVEGTVQRSGDRVRITAQLIEGPSDKHMWASSYERDIRDVFALQRDVTEEITRQIQSQLAAPTQARPPHKPINPTALEAYLQGNHHLNKYGRSGGDEEKNKAAVLFQQAIDADPDFAPAYRGLASAHFALMWPSKEDGEIFIKLNQRALELDPNFSDARVDLASVKVIHWDYRGAEEELRRAIALAPSSAYAHDGLCGLLFDLGRNGEGMKECEIAQELDPTGNHLAEAFYSEGDYDRAIQIVQTMLQINPDDGGLHYSLARYYAAKGMYRQAGQEDGTVALLFGDPDAAERIHRAVTNSDTRAAIRQAARELESWFAEKRYYGPVNRAEVYAVLGDKDRAFKCLEEAYKNRDIQWDSLDTGLESIEEERVLDPLHSDPRFKKLLQRIGLSDIQAPSPRSNRGANATIASTR
jgi:TolB-like protein/DNA-binding winged helix-turn-helix (wHTH) protein